MKRNILLIALFSFVRITIAQWQPTSGPNGGSVCSFAAIGTSIFAGTNGAGVLLSTNNGSNWSQASAGLTYPYINSLLVIGNNLFAGAADITNRQGGVFISTNNGTSWNILNNGLPNIPISMVCNIGSAIFAGGYAGTYISYNNGANWSETINSTIGAIAQSGTNLVGCGNNNLFLSLDTGKTWLLDSVGIGSGTFAGVVACGPYVFAATQQRGIFRSADNGLSWSLITTSLIDSQSVYNILFSTLIVTGTTLYAGTVSSGLLVSTDFGLTWTSIVYYPNIQGIYANGSNLFLGLQYSGVALSTDGGSTWSNNINTGLNITNTVALMAKDSILFSGVDSWGDYRSTNNGASWIADTTATVGMGSSSFAYNGTSLFAINDGTSGIFQSNDYGNTWTTVTSGLSNQYVSSLAAGSGILLAGTINPLDVGTDTGGVFISTNNGYSWSETSLTGMNINAIGIFGNQIYAGGSNEGAFLGLFKSTNNGTTWSPTGLPTIFCVRSIMMNGNNLYVGTGDAVGDGDGMFLSSDGGNTWTTINNGLSNTDIHSIIVSGSVIFVGTYQGVFMSTTNGKSWINISLDMVNSSINTLAILGNNLFAATNGSSVWFAPIDSLEKHSLVWPGDANNDGKVDNTDLLAIGLGYGRTGTIRQNSSITWIGQSSQDWTDSLATGTNDKYVDCNGDGIINGNDTIAVLLNYDSIQSYKLKYQMFDETLPELYIKCANDSLAPGGMVLIQIGLGNSSLPVSNIYGLAFSIDYSNPALVDIMSSKFSSVTSWLGTKGSNLISLCHANTSSANANLAICKTDKANSSGFGVIGEFTCTLQNPITSTNYQNLKFSISDVTLINNNGTILNITAGSDSVVVKGSPAGIKETQLQIQIGIYPNPANDNFVIETTAMDKQLLRIFDVTGNLILTQVLNSPSTTINAQDFAQGFYDVCVSGNEGRTNQRLVIVR